MFDYFTYLSNYHDTNWIDFYILLKHLSKSLRAMNKDAIEYFLIHVIYSVMCFAKQNDINLQSSWKRWIVKADFKHYY